MHQLPTMLPTKTMGTFQSSTQSFQELLRSATQHQHLELRNSGHRFCRRELARVIQSAIDIVGDIRLEWETEANDEDIRM